ncbi:MAG: DUF1801 domain-containing protein [Caulobacter sp.]|nr:DUF1801 domain-containing protein [Caulobacter sp.]
MDSVVAAFIADLDHPMKAEIESVRALILGLGPEIGEGIKWKSPTFRTTDDFATINLRSTGSLQVILHLGAKVRPDLQKPMIEDPEGLLKWLGKDRCMATLGAGDAFRANLPAFKAVLRQWIAVV